MIRGEATDQNALQDNIPRIYEPMSWQRERKRARALDAVNHLDCHCYLKTFPIRLFEASLARVKNKEPIQTSGFLDVVTRYGQG